MSKIAVVHYMPLEYYPPVTNFLDVVLEEPKLEIKVFSTKNNKNRKEYSNAKLNKINRSPFPAPGENTVIRLYKYLAFNISCFLRLVQYNPKTILYYETYSAGPVYWYLRLFGRNKKLKIHYHEYFSKDWYEKGMLLTRKYHEYEKKFLYCKADWISQTNIDRVRLFLKDQPEVDPQKMKILPNYPPASWGSAIKQQKKGSSVLKTVYIGSLSLEATFIREYCDWVKDQKGAVIFDIYAYNLHQDTTDYLYKLNCPYINFIREGIEYDKIPLVLRNYDVGLILYKALSKNYEYNAPNKLFEYLACGLEIWFSDKMKGCIPYIKSQHPRIMPVDFLNIDNTELMKAKSGVVNLFPEKYTAEAALKPLIVKLKE